MTFLIKNTKPKKKEKHLYILAPTTYWKMTGLLMEFTSGHHFLFCWENYVLNLRCTSCFVTIKRNVYACDLMDVF